jgi:hypothetical protein
VLTTSVCGWFIVGSRHFFVKNGNAGGRQGVNRNVRKSAFRGVKPSPIFALDFTDSFISQLPFLFFRLAGMLSLAGLHMLMSKLIMILFQNLAAIP